MMEEEISLILHRAAKHAHAGGQDWQHQPGMAFQAWDKLASANTMTQSNYSMERDFLPLHSLCSFPPGK